MVLLPDDEGAAKRLRGNWIDGADGGHWRRSAEKGVVEGLTGEINYELIYKLICRLNV